MSPAVSVITVCRDARAELLRTKASVDAQACRDFQWIVIDGASKDGTAEVLDTLDLSFTRWVSEADTGIYDAMNKGLDMATGNRVWFMNAGDTFHKEDALGKVVSTNPEVDICFGETLIVDENGQMLGPRSTITPHVLPEKLEKSRFRHGMVVSHQAFVPRREIAPSFQDRRYRYSADLDWMLAILSSPRSSTHLGTLATVLREGATLQNWNRSQWERFCILSRHFGFRANLGNHFRIVKRRLGHGRRTRIWR